MNEITEKYLKDPKLNCPEFYKHCIPMFMTAESITWLLTLLDAITNEPEAPDEQKQQSMAIKGAIAVSLGHKESKMQ